MTNNDILTDNKVKISRRLCSACLKKLVKCISPALRKMFLKTWQWNISNSRAIFTIEKKYWYWKYNQIGTPKSKCLINNKKIPKISQNVIKQVCSPCTRHLRAHTLNSLHIPNSTKRISLLIFFFYLFLWRPWSWWTFKES